MIRLSYFVADVFASMPRELVRWDPNRENEVFFSQSVALYASYYHLQILIHRPFIPTPRNPSPLSFPSLAICTNAARSCSHVVDMHRKRGLRALSHAQVSGFVPDKRIFDDLIRFSVECVLGGHRPSVEHLG